MFDALRCFFAHDWFDVRGMPPLKILGSRRAAWGPATTHICTRCPARKFAL